MATIEGADDEIPSDADRAVRVPDEGEPGWDLVAREPGRMEDGFMRDAARRSQDLRRVRAGEPQAAGRRE
jgi:hypothetical protein